MKRETFEKLCCALRSYAEEGATDRSLWHGGRAVPELNLLGYLLDIAAHEGVGPRTGNIAGALDMWLAEELRLAGLDERGVWPRNQPPQVLDPSVADLASRLPGDLARALQREMGHIGGTEARVRGAAYAKQVDVGMATWPSGPDLLISTKTMSGSFGKNWANRFEEAYGDIKNLKGRHPLAVSGFVMLLHENVLNEQSNVVRIASMLEKLQGESDAYDVVALIIARWDGTGAELSAGETVDKATHGLMISSFFDRLCDLLLRRCEVGGHERLRRLREES